MNNPQPELVIGSQNPLWSEVEYSPGGARDALRLETASEAILEDLLPGINNGTQRARYYSFWAWALHEFIRDEGAVHDQRGFYEWLRPREAMLVFSHLLHEHDTGAAGTTQGKIFWQNGEPETYPLDWKSLTSVNGGACQLYYTGALEEMNIIAKESEQPHDILQRPVGVNLAEAYARSVSSTAYIKSYPNATQATKHLIEDYAEAGCLCRLPPFPEERKALTNAFFRFDVNDANAVKRLASLCFFLDIIDQSQGAPLDTASMRAVIYFWSYGTDHAYVPDGNLLSPAKRWRIFQLRQYYVFSIECLWALFLAKIHNSYFTPDEYLDWLISGLDLNEVGGQFGVTFPESAPDRLTMHAFQETLETAKTDYGFEPGPLALAGELNEHYIHSPLYREPSSDPEANLWAGSALLMLSLMRRRCRHWSKDVGWDYATENQEDDHLSIEGYLKQMDYAIAESWTVAQWLSWSHQRHLWLRHRWVGLQKMISRREDPSLFTWDDNTFYGLGKDQPKMNGPRFQNALQIMEDLRLIQSLDQGSRAYSLLPEGENLLQRFRSYTIPHAE